jgi:hypothetical protein
VRQKLEVLIEVATIDAARRWVETASVSGLKCVGLI